MRWRRAKNPDAGGRWDTPMNRMIWHRDHGNDLELVQSGQILATVRPSGAWSLDVGPNRLRTQVASSVDDAKSAAVEAVRALRRGAVNS